MNINCSTSATISIQSSNYSDFSVVDYDSGVLNIFESNQTTAEGNWKSGNWWWGRISEDMLSGYVRNYFADFGEIENRYVRVNISDPGNSTGYIDIGRLLIGPVTQYLINYSYDAKLQWVDLSIKTRAIGGKPISDKRPMYRAFTFNFDFLSDSEAMTAALEIERILGVTGELFVAPDTDDIQNKFRRSFLGQLSELTGISKYAAGLNRTAYKIEEIL